MDLKQKVIQLELVVEQHSRIFKAHGITSEPWVSVTDFCKVTPYGRKKVLGEINRAEKIRLKHKSIARKYSDLLQGRHYVDVSDLDADKPKWSINLVEFQKVLDMPKDERNPGDMETFGRAA